MRKCTTCKELKHENDFYQSQQDSICKECRKAYRRATYVSKRKTPKLTEEEKRKRYNEYHRKYRERKKDTLNKRRRENYRQRTEEQKELKRKRSEHRNANLYTEGGMQIYIQRVIIM